MHTNDYLRDSLLQHLNGDAVWTPPSNLYLAALKTAAAPNDTTATNAAKEVNTPGANGYTRTEVTFSFSAGVLKIDTQRIVGPATAAWDAIVGVWITDDPDADQGNILLGGPIKASTTVVNTGQMIVDVDAITYTIT